MVADDGEESDNEENLSEDGKMIKKQMEVEGNKDDAAQQFNAALNLNFEVESISTIKGVL